jgi:prepilin-type N-terminal cleavage/methylation domain-containing protein
MFINNRAFSLLEVTVVIIIMTILVSAAIPVLSRAYIDKASNKTALDIGVIQEASRSYYIDHNQWPDSSVYPNPIATLQAGNYLPSTWNPVNPFGIAGGNSSNYDYHVSSTGSTLTVDTLVPVAAQSIIENLLPTSGILPNNNVYSTVPVPGSSSVLPTGMIIPWASGNLPTGFLFCDGAVYNVSTYPALANVLGNSFGGDGINTFAVPNLQGKTIFGYQSGDSNFGALGNSGGAKTLVGDGVVSGHVDTFNFYNRVKIANGSLWGMTGGQSAEGVSTAILNPYMTLNYVIKT